MERYYICENGEDIAIETFDSAFEAILFAEEHEKVREIFEYIKTDDEKIGENIECVGLIWKRN